MHMYVCISLKQYWEKGIHYREKGSENFHLVFSSFKTALEAFSTSFASLPPTQFCLLLPTLLLLTLLLPTFLSSFSKEKMTIPGKQ